MAYVIFCNSSDTWKRTRGALCPGIDVGSSLASLAHIFNAAYLYKSDT